MKWKKSKDLVILLDNGSTIDAKGIVCKKANLYIAKWTGLGPCWMLTHTLTKKVISESRGKAKLKKLAEKMHNNYRMRRALRFDNQLFVKAYAPEKMVHKILKLNGKA
jgi:hypothetical protein